METKETTTGNYLKPTPHPGEGRVIITALNTGIRAFQKKCAAKSTRGSLFRTIFGNTMGDYLLAKYTRPSDGSIAGERDFEGFFLNLDTSNKIALLPHLLEGPVELKLPDIPDWQERGKKLGWDSGDDDLDMEDLRSLWSLCGDLTVWDVYPPAMIWVNKWLLFACNNGIGDNNFGFAETFTLYPGDKYGNWKNWSVFWDNAGSDLRLEIAKYLIEYK